ncbi:MAG: ISL3 family transposase [Proteobacteria bacterium]|nr:ISL3 family transposase [Pseudomonadota bacterium]
MNSESLFTVALGITPPLHVEGVEFSKENKRLDIKIGFQRGATFACPVCGTAAPVHDTSEKTWRHLNFFQFEAYLTARVPRVKCPNADHGVKQVQVPWARAGSGFTLLFEALVMALVREMPVKAAAAMLGEHDTRIWRVIDHYVQSARAQADYSEVRRVGMDETSARRGQDYISLFFDMDERQLLFGTAGHDHETVKAFTEDLKAHNGVPENITDACLDMSKAFIKGVTEALPNAEITFDPFHLIKHMNDALSQVRAEEAKFYPEMMKGSRYAFLKNPENLTPKQDATLHRLCGYRLKTARAYLLKLALQDVYFAPSHEEATIRLKNWYSRAIRCQIKQVREVAKTVKNHWHGILSWFNSQLSNGFLEAVNGLIQAAKRRARGYRTTKNLINMAYLIAGKLDFRLPT